MILIGTCVAAVDCYYVAGIFKIFVSAQAVLTLCRLCVVVVECFCSPFVKKL